MTSRRKSGFALVITLTLLALLVLALYALSALSKVGSEVAAMSIYQTQARQNALLGLHQALGELQHYAGGDGVITGMAGITGVPAGAGNPARHWCGVWASNGQFLRWLASGASGATIPPLTGADAIELVSTNSLNSDVTDREHVSVLRLPVAITAGDGRNLMQGGSAYWLGDEGVKLSLVIPDAEAVAAGIKHAIDKQFTGIAPDNPTLAKLLLYEQLSLVGATTVQRQGGFHSHARTHYQLQLNGAGLKAGALNVNSSSVRYWTGVGATFTRLNPTAGASLSHTGFGAAAAALSGRPFLDVDGFLAGISTYLTNAGISPGEFDATMRPWFTTRSDTFRIRAYGDAFNPADPAQNEATAWCEAIVQRVKDSPSATTGRFVISGFRWLGPDDI